MQSLETLTERDFDSVWEIMEESFPRDERRSREAQRKILDVSWVSPVRVPCTWGTDGVFWQCGSLIHSCLWSTLP